MAGLDGRKISSPPGFDPGPSSPQSVAISIELLGPHTHTHTHTHVYIYILTQHRNLKRLESSMHSYFNDSWKSAMFNSCSHYEGRNFLGSFLLSARTRLSTSSCLSVLPHVLAPLLLDGFPWNLILGNYMKVRRENPNSVKVRHFTLHEGLNTCYCCRRH